MEWKKLKPSGDTGYILRPTRNEKLLIIDGSTLCYTKYPELRTGSEPRGPLAEEWVEIREGKAQLHNYPQTQTLIQLLEHRTHFEHTEGLPERERGLAKLILDKLDEGDFTRTK